MAMTFVRPWSELVGVVCRPRFLKWRPVTAIPNQTLEQDSAKWPQGNVAVGVNDYMVPRRTRYGGSHRLLAVFCGS
ncbi:MAG TPA: hypothetical protein VGG45_00140 [Terracidiphilus sp.]|jgi:hypothetical protein